MVFYLLNYHLIFSTLLELQLNYFNDAVSSAV